jgi:hypothetical protein
MALIIVFTGLGLFSVGVIIDFFISTIKAFRKYDGLDMEVQRKTGRIECYMALVRNFSKEELKKISELTDEEISYYNSIADYDIVIKKIKEKIRNKK